MQFSFFLKLVQETTFLIKLNLDFNKLCMKTKFWEIENKMMQLKEKDILMLTKTSSYYELQAYSNILLQQCNTWDNS